MMGGNDGRSFSWGSMVAAGVSSLAAGGLDAIAGETWLRSTSSNLFTRKINNALGDGFKALITSPIEQMAGDIYEYGRLHTDINDYFTGGFKAMGTTTGISFASAWVQGKLGGNKWDRMTDGQKTDWLGSKTNSLVAYHNDLSTVKHGAILLETSKLYHKSVGRGIIKYFNSINRLGKPSLKLRFGF